MNKTILASLALSCLLLAPDHLFAQGDLLGQNLYLFSLEPHDDKPEISFANNGWSSRIQQNNGTMFFFNHDNIPVIQINRDAGDHALVVHKKGIGINSVSDDAFSVFSHDGSDVANASIRLNELKSPVKLRTMLTLNNNGPVRFEFQNHESAQTWAFQTNNSDGFLINRLGSGGNEFAIRKSGMVTMGPGGKLNLILDPAGNLDIDGTLTQSCDRDKKESFAEVDSQKILESVMRLPITTWRYKDDTAGVRHLGPVSQDFHREFQLGKGDKTIAAVDADGIALAATQALNDKLEEQANRIAELEQQIDLLVNAFKRK